MNIELSEEQFIRLLKLAHLGNYVVNGARESDGEDQKISKYDEIEGFLLKFAYENQCEGLVLYDLKNNKYAPAESLEYDDEMEAFIEEYNEDVFWEELGSRLAERDMMEEMGEEIVLKLDDGERLKVLSEAKEKYFDEFEENGVDNLRLALSLLPDGLPIM
jgi:hypothetical protein